jgi:beta-lactamase class A
LPEEISIAHKTGTGGTEGGITGATNDIGIITLRDGRHILIAVYVSDSPANTGVREKVIADAAACCDGSAGHREVRRGRRRR